MTASRRIQINILNLIFTWVGISFFALYQIVNRALKVLAIRRDK